MAQRHMSSYLEVVNREAVHSQLDRVHLGIKHTELVESRHYTPHARRITSWLAD